MALFLTWLIHRDAATLLRLLENSQFFNPQDYNAVFNGELGKLLARIQDPALRQQVSELMKFDWANYLERSLRKANVRDDDDRQEAFHSIVVKLLVKPGKLFRGWNPNRHGPLDRRFKRSVWNAIFNAREKSQNQRRLTTPTDPSILAATHPGRQPYSSLLDDFRKIVSQRLGKLALAILGEKLAGAEIKRLVGNPDLGKPTAYQVKKEVQNIKELLHRFAAQSGDATFLRQMERALEAETATIEKRRTVVAARSARAS